MDQIKHNMKKQYLHLLYLPLFLLIGYSCQEGCKKPDAFAKQMPVIYPDYKETVFPQNIAAPTFIIKETGKRFQTEIVLENKVLFTYVESTNELCIPLDDWKDVLEEAAGKKIFFRISVLKENDQWIQYQNIENEISKHSIDNYLSYRLLYPGYELWNEMGIYQRNLASYEETAILENKSINKQCINCHTFNKNSPNTMMMHVRGKSGGTIIYKNGKVEKVNTRPSGFANAGTYASWHPSGDYIAFSMNEIQQFFHASGKKPIEVSDLAADLVVYDVKKHVLYTDSLLFGKAYMETFPNWSPDGKTLYYCRAKGYTPNTPLDSIRYDLYKVSFDPQKHTFGTPQCVYAASENKKSVSFPRISPNGRYLMFTLSNYGNFSIWHPESDLYLIDLANGKVRMMSEVNSDQVESYHSWSSDGKWFTFSSKRLDGLWARPYIAFFDEKTGKASKPFLLPQEHPLFYDNFTKTYNLPEFITSPVNQEKRFSEIVKEAPASVRFDQ